MPLNIFLFITLAIGFRRELDAVKLWKNPARIYLLNPAICFFCKKKYQRHSMTQDSFHKIVFNRFLKKGYNITNYD